MLFAVDETKVETDGNFLTIPGVRLKEVMQPMKPLSDRLTRPIHKRFDPSIREANMAQKRHEDMPLCRRVTGNISCWRAFSTMRSSIVEAPIHPYPGRFRHAKVDTLSPWIPEHTADKVVPLGYKISRLFSVVRHFLVRYLYAFQMLGEHHLEYQYRYTALCLQRLSAAIAAGLFQHTAQ